MNTDEVATILSKYPDVLKVVEDYMKIASGEGTIDITAELFAAGSSEEDLTKLTLALTHHFAPRYIFYTAFDWIGWIVHPIPLPYKELIIGTSEESKAPDFDKICGICSEAYIDKDFVAKLTKCSHTFHSECLIDHVGGVKKCPSCP